MEAKAVLDSGIVVAATIYKSVLLTQVGLEGQRGLALVIDILDAVAHHADQGVAHSLAAHVHTHTVGLHHGGGTITVDDETRQIVALTVYESVGIVALVVGYAYGYTHLQRRSQAALPELGVNLDLTEGQHSDGDGTYLIVATGEEIAR